MLRDTAQDCSPLKVLLCLPRRSLRSFFMFTKEVVIKDDNSPPGLTLLGLSLLSDPASVSAILPENHQHY